MWEGGDGGVCLNEKTKGRFEVTEVKLKELLERNENAEGVKG